MSNVFKFGEILLPQNIDVSNWAVVACDQFTSEPNYWEELKTKTHEPTTLSLIFPECYLGQDDENRIKTINDSMRKYEQDGVFKSVQGTVLVKRTTENGTRYGLMGCVNLANYSNDFSQKALIRGTEGVVASRIPPRVKIRKDATIELPHVMVLIDDKDKTVIEPLIGSGKVLYDGQLNMNGGYVTGYNVTDTTKVEKALEKLLELSQKKYGEKLLFLVGDGNHSLSTAKACYDENNELSNYALVEIVNIYDEGLKFEPIHRVVFGVDKDKFIAGLKNAISGQRTTTLYYDGKKEEIPFELDSIQAVAKCQKYIDEYIAINGGSVDYIHGTQSLIEVTDSTDGVGIMLKSIDKETFFDYVVKNGPMPRKTFSMGEANEKRYYMECRKIK